LKITIESTGELATINGVPCRLWQGETETGIPVVAMVAILGVERAEDCEQFDRELLEQAAPRPDLAAAFPSRNLRR
jgi:hypothetical protein